MAAKLLHSLADDNQDLQKQIGCMKGIFQLFDRQHIGHNPKRLTAGSLYFNNDTSEKDLCSVYQRSPTAEEIRMNKNVQDKQKFSSPSQPSSFPSLDCSRPATPQHLAFDRAYFPETPLRDQLKTSQQQYGRQILDIRDVVKDSMGRETQGLSVKSNSFNGNYETSLDVKQNLPVDLTESLRVLAKLREETWYCSEPRELSRTSSSSYHSKDVPSLSYDAREAIHLSSESQNILKSNSKLKDQPRLSPDIRNTMSTRQQMSGAKARPPSVVAKLMGLETLPDTNMGSKSHLKEPTTPRWSPDSVMKPISRFPIEPASWRKFDRTKVSENHAARNSKSLKKPLNSFPSAYSEIEKRFMDPEFTESGKNLRALKQILEEMQRKGDQTAAAMKGSDSLKHFESSIVIMKPAKLLDKYGSSSSSVIPLNDLSSSHKLQGAAATSVTMKDQNLKTSKRVNMISSARANGRTSRSQISDRSENSSGILKNSGSISSRLQQKKPTPPSDSKISRRQAFKQQMKCSSPGGKHRQKSSNILRNDDQLRENEVSNQSNGSIISDLKEDTEVSNTPQSFEKSSNRSPSRKTVAFVQKKPTSVLLEDEYPSPVSVLDNFEYTDESPSPVKHISGYMKDDNDISYTFGSAITLEINRKKLQKIENLVQKLRRLNSSHDEVHTDYIASICESTNPDHRYVAEILLASGLLLGDLGSSITSYQFHPSGHPINPELFLVLEQTKESTFVKEECTIENSTKMKIHRKLIFDFVNETLAAKLALVGHFSEPWLRPKKAAMNALNAQKLLRELCVEIEQIQAKSYKDEADEPRNISWEDMLHSQESWFGFTYDISNVVLDVERSIFRDLVDEIVRGDGNSLRTKPTSRQRQLFRI